MVLNQVSILLVEFSAYVSNLPENSLNPLLKSDKTSPVLPQILSIESDNVYPTFSLSEEIVSLTVEEFEFTLLIKSENKASTFSNLESIKSSYSEYILSNKSCWFDIYLSYSVSFKLSLASSNDTFNC